MLFELSGQSGVAKRKRGNFSMWKLKVISFINKKKSTKCYVKSGIETYHHDEGDSILLTCIQTVIKDQ